MDIQIKSLLCQAKKPGNNGELWGYKKQLPLLTLLHFSDVHGDAAAIRRVCDFIAEYDEFIDGSLCTGDVVETCWNADFVWEQDVRTKGILSCIGNHDILADWEHRERRISQEESYQRYFAPYIAHWGCAYQENKTFYYKDYAAHAIRLIVLNCVLQDAEQEEQLDWLTSVLQDALQQNLHVIMAMHYPVIMQKIPCNFSTLDPIITESDKAMEVYQEKVASFIEAGGNFVVWLTGHLHVDCVGYNERFPNQLCISIDALRSLHSNAYNDADRREEMPSQDLYNLVTVDTVSHLVKVIRVGSNLDRYLRKRDTLCIDYKTFAVIA